jgi:hypothetical protein
MPDAPKRTRLPVDCPSCAEPIFNDDPVTTERRGRKIHVRCWKPRKASDLDEPNEEAGSVA